MPQAAERLNGPCILVVEDEPDVAEVLGLLFTRSGYRVDARLVGAFKALNMKKLQRILHVEDEADITAVAKLALERVGGFTIRSSASDEEAFQEA
ncbi:hypothetical protein [Marinobacter salinus]|uniref:hypothetical protein n=1 Tax=Marinobacter salinus TaxID=1874317 RepID=UPI0018E0AFCC|nr:hypothetical protein [Marinobacter salinus]